MVFPRISAAAALPLIVVLVVVGAELPSRGDDSRFESPLPAGALARLGTSRFQHAFSLRAVAISPDGKVIASGSGKGTIRLWEADTGRELRVLTAHTSTIAGLAFSSDGKMLASASWDRTLRLWDAASGKAMRTVAAHTQGVMSVAFAPDDKRMLTTSSDQTAKVWDTATGAELLQLTGHGDGVDAGVFSHDGKLIATASLDKTIRLWDAATGKELRKLEGHTTRVRGVAFSPDDKRLISGGWDTKARLWEVGTGKPLAALQHTSGIEGVAFSPDGKSVALALGWDNTVRVWDVTGETGKPLWTGKVGQAFTVAFSRDGKKLIAGGWDSRVHVWDAVTGKESAASTGPGHTGWVHGVGFLADRNTLVSASSDGKVILWDAARGKELRVLDTPANRSWCLAVSPDGKTFATGGNDQAISIWDARTGMIAKTLKFEGPIKGVAFSPDGKRLAAVSDDSSNDGSAKPVPGHGAAVFELATGKLLFKLEGHESGVKAVAFSAEGKTIATGGADKTGRLWDAATGKELSKVEGHANAVEAVAFSPDGKFWATAGQGGTVLLRRLGSDDPPVSLNTRNNELEAVVFSPDSRLIATATRRVNQVKFAIVVWDVMTGKERARFPGNQETAWGLAFSRDGRVLASGGGDGTVLLWDVTGRVENGKFATADLPPPSLEGEWTDLVGDDPAKVHKAVWELVAAPKQSLPLLREALKPVMGGDEKRIAQLVKDLDNDTFETREKASAELAHVGEPAGPALRKALEGTPSAEMRVRITQLLDKFGGKVASADVVRRERALEVLEHIDSADARALMGELAKGAPEATLTLEAKAALKRLEK
jgi:WD40 repeat protein